MIYCACLAVALAQDSIPKWQAPPGDESPQIKALIDKAQQGLQSGEAASNFLSDRLFDEVRSYPRFRQAIRKFSPIGEVTVVSPDEPGERLDFTFDLGKPDQLIYLYHTDSRGAYAKNGVHFQANSGDHNFARLFAYVKTDKNGKARILTIRPAGYPGGELPQHIHFFVEPLRSKVDEIWFSDDPRLTQSVRQRGLNTAHIVTPIKSERGWRAEAKITLLNN